MELETFGTLTNRVSRVYQELKRESKKGLACAALYMILGLFSISIMVFKRSRMFSIGLSVLAVWCATKAFEHHKRYATVYQYTNRLNKFLKRYGLTFVPSDPYIVELSK